MSRARELLGPSGPLAASMNGYELREGQLQMAEAVERALDEDRVVLCEAGTGTGKTLAYLVPALLSGRRVVVSTGSKALQEQIALKDLPLIAQHLGIEPNAMMVKGLNNYLCLRRFAELSEALTQSGPGSSTGRPELRRALPIVRDWAERTSVGDVSELAELAESHPVWREIASSSETRIGQRCDYFEDCHVTRMKRAAQQAQLLIANHHLLLADLAIKGEHPGGVLPSYDAVIIDEAHKLEDVATAFFGARVSSARVDRMLRDAERALRAASAIGRDEPARLVVRATALTAEFFAALNLLASKDVRTSLGSEVWSGNVLELYHALDNAIDALEQLAQLHVTHESTALACTRLGRLRQELAVIVDSHGDRVTWLERTDHGLSLSSSPVDVGPILRERLFGRGHAVVLTSASLTTSRGFEFVRSRLGLVVESHGAIDAPIDEMSVPSAIDHHAQSLLYTPTDLPEVRDEGFVDAAAERVAQLVTLTPGGVFVLCTSLRVMRSFSERLAKTLERSPLVQGDAPKAALLDRFRTERDGLLVATMSFWEGVDVPGEALRMVIIDRLPFEVPTDPLVKARCRSIEASGRSPFSDYTVPRAAITLKQGFGRLLRRRSDYGVVAILDKRISTRSYGQAMRDSLPVVPSSGAIEDVARFFERRREEAEAW
jgi:ATP-dependent DNA helicase DinG